MNFAYAYIPIIVLIATSVSVAYGEEYKALADADNAVASCDFDRLGRAGHANCVSQVAEELEKEIERVFQKDLDQVKRVPGGKKEAARLRKLLTDVHRAWHKYRNLQCNDEVCSKGQPGNACLPYSSQCHFEFAKARYKALADGLMDEIEPRVPTETAPN